MYINQFYKEMFTKEPMDLAQELTTQYSEPIPQKIDTIREMKKAGELLLLLTNNLSYLCTIDIYATILESEAKEITLNDKDNEELHQLYENAKLRHYAIKKVKELVEKKYAGLSRAITVKQQVNDELKRTDAR